MPGFAEVVERLAEFIDQVYNADYTRRSATCSQCTSRSDIPGTWYNLRP